MKRRTSRSYSQPPSPSRSTSPKNYFNYASIALFGGIFVLGVGVGIVFSNDVSFTPENVASREIIDRSAPNAELCIQYGASAIVSDMRIFLTLNPFNVYVSQPRMQPGCVLRRNNWYILEQQGLLNKEEVGDCKNRMNTFGFTGPLEGSPKINCIYQNNAAGNLFLDQHGSSGVSETEKF